MVSNQALLRNFVAAAALMVFCLGFYWLSTLAAMKARLSLSAEQMRELDAASATLRNDCHDRFKFYVIRHLELNAELRAVSNTELEQAIAACIGITHVDISDAIPPATNKVSDNSISGQTNHTQRFTIKTGYGR